jgi:hypothetical protein
MASSLPAATSMMPQQSFSNSEFEAFHHHIQEMVLLGYTDDGIVAALGAQGFKTSARSLRRRLQAWGIRRHENG